MYISHNWLKEFVDFDYSPSEIDSILTGLGIEVEHIVDYTEKYKNFFIGHVLHHDKHPNADKLSVCLVDYGDGEKTIVCGAPNVAQGQKVVVGIPGACVPNSKIILEKRKVRNVESEGMICAQVELELGEDHDGIWILPESAEMGMTLLDYLNLNDVIYEIGITPNRSDCLSHLGIAREIAAYSRQKIRKPEVKFTEGSEKSSDFVSVEILDADKCPRYTGRVIKNIKMQESPQWLKQRLIMLGQRPVNAVVDVTNYILLECGQPLHAFDLRDLKGNKIIVKTAENEQKFTTLDSKERILDSSMLMICDAERPVAVGGVMGGENSEVKNDTVDILLESAYFSPASIRRTSKRLALQSESSYRFERGIDWENVAYASDRAATLIAEITGGTVCQGIIDAYPVKIGAKEVTLRYKRANNVIGTDLSTEEIREMLLALDFEIISENSDTITLKVPTYRVDISMEIDLIEEIARLYNYDNIQPDFSVSIDSSGTGSIDELKVPELRAVIREYLVANGYNEALTQNMIDPKSSAVFTEDPVVIANPLGEELSILRSSLFPSMLKTIERNHRLRNLDLQLFEVGKTFKKVGADVATFIPGIYENEELLIVITGKSLPTQWGSTDRQSDFYDIRGIIEDLLTSMKIKKVRLLPISEDHPVLSKNTVSINLGNQIVGYIGEVNQKILKQFDINYPVFAANLHLHKLYKIDRKQWKFSSVSPFPTVTRDLALLVDDAIPSEDLRQAIQKNAGNICKSVDIFDVYKGKNLAEGKKSIAFSVSYSANDRTLTDTEVDNSVTQIVKFLETKFNAELRKF